MTRLVFLAGDGAPFVSPLRHALAAGGVRSVTDVSALGKLEVRGDLDRLETQPGEELIRITPSRGLLVCDGSTLAARERLAADGFRTYDQTSALAALEVDGEDLLRRLTELDLEALPAVGAIARGTPAVIERRAGERFRIFVPQELGHYVAEVVLDLAEGLAR